MKARIVLAGLLVSMVVVEVSAQRAEYDDMYFRGKDRAKNKSSEAEIAYASAKKTKKQKPEEVAITEEQHDSNPTDSYSARNVNPEYVSRSNSEQASEDEGNYYVEGYTPALSTYSNSNFNNSYYNNTIPAANSYYGMADYNYMNRGFGCMYCSPQMSWMMSSSPYYRYGYYDPWMNPYYSGFSSGWSLSLTYGYGYGLPYYPYYGGYGYPAYYGGGGYESPATVNYGKRPSRHSAVVRPTQRVDNRVRTMTAEESTTVTSGSRTRPRQMQDEYYVRPSRRTSAFENPTQWNQINSGNTNNEWAPSSTPSRTRNSYDPSPSRSSSGFTPSSTPSFSPSSSPSRGGSSGGGGGSSTPRPRGRN